MQNIDPIYSIQPVVATTFGTRVVVAWYVKKKALFADGDSPDPGRVRGRSLPRISYRRSPTGDLFVATFGFTSPAIGLYFCLQTVFFEVGGAYMLALYAVSRGRVYSTLSGSRPELFYPPAQALPIVALGTLERLSSFLVHLVFGYL